LVGRPGFERCHDLNRDPSRDNGDIAKKPLIPSAVEVDTGFRGGPTVQKTYLGILTNEKGQVVWDCNSTSTHQGRSHHSTFEAVRCAVDELNRRGAGA
jgi:hypothetical protein